MATKRKNRSPQAPKSRSLATRDMLLYAAQRGQAPTDKAERAYRRRPKHRAQGWSE